MPRDPASSPRRPATRRPTAAELQAAAGRTVPDLIAPELDVLLCGINPSLYSGVTGYHFARPGNRFWPALDLAGVTPRRLAPEEGRALLASGWGITNVVARATATAAELSEEELRAGGRRLAAKVRRYRPRVLAVLGVTAYRSAFARPGATFGPQDDAIGGARVWVLPNPSGLNAHFTLDRLAAMFAELRTAVERPGR